MSIMPTNAATIFDLSHVKTILQQLLTLTDEQIVHQPTDSSTDNSTQNRPLIKLKLVETSPMGAVKLEFYSNKELERITSDCQTTISMVTEGRQAYELMMRAYCLLHSSRGKSLLKKQQLSLINSTPIRQQESETIQENPFSFEFSLLHKTIVDVEQPRLATANLIVHTETDHYPL